MEKFIPQKQWKIYTPPSKKILSTPPLLFFFLNMHIAELHRVRQKGATLFSTIPVTQISLAILDPFL